MYYGIVYFFGGSYPGAVLAQAFSPQWPPMAFSPWDDGPWAQSTGMQEGPQQSQATGEQCG
jgi:hypothetical protein